MIARANRMTTGTIRAPDSVGAGYSLLTDDDVHYFNEGSSLQLHAGAAL